ncbi:MAG: dihydroorotase family protein [Gemmatimonadetes bacterium]|nr:dihydroorotase family protein [Gemmatimonadota bacterium]
MSFDLVIRGGTLVTPDGVRPGALGVRDGRLAAVAGPDTDLEAPETWDATGLHVLPGAIDIHCHIRSPAYPERGTVESETIACAAGGITTVFEMPITDPCCNSPERVAIRRAHFAAHARVDFALYAAPAELTRPAFEALADAGVVALKIFTIPAPVGREHEFEGLAWPHLTDQLQALKLAAEVGLPVVVHAEHPEVLARSASRAARLDPALATTHEVARPALAESLAVAQLLTLNMEARAQLHIAHVTSIATLNVLRRFAGSSDFTAETCPQYLRHTSDDVARVGVFGKVNPPIRTAEDREALWSALSDGTLGHVTTDHTSFSFEEKSAHAGNFLTAPPGHPGTELLLPTLLSGVADGRLTLPQVAELTSGAAARRFRLPDRGTLGEGARAHLAVVDLDGETRPTADNLQTAARDLARLAHGQTYRGRVAAPFVAGRPVWDGSAVDAPPGWGRFVRPGRRHSRESGS